MKKTLKIKDGSSQCLEVKGAILKKKSKMKNALCRNSTILNSKGIKSQYLTLKRNKDKALVLIEKAKHLLDVNDDLSSVKSDFQVTKQRTSSIDNGKIGHKSVQFQDKLDVRKKIKLHLDFKSLEMNKHIKRKRSRNEPNEAEVIDLCNCEDFYFLKVCLQCSNLNESLAHLQSKINMLVDENNLLKKKNESLMQTIRENEATYAVKLDENKKIKPGLEIENLNSNQTSKLTGVQKNVNILKNDNKTRLFEQECRKEQIDNTKVTKNPKKMAHNFQEIMVEDTVTENNDFTIARKVKDLPRTPTKSNFNGKYESVEKIWVCFECIPPKMLSEEKFMKHADFYLHLDNCVLYDDIIKADAAITKYENIGELDITITNNQIRNMNIDVNDIKKEVVDLTYSWNDALSEFCKYSLPKKLDEEDITHRRKIIKSDIKVIQCSKCLKEFPTKEGKNLHTCDSISDKHYVSKVHVSSRERNMKREKK